MIILFYKCFLLQVIKILVIVISLFVVCWSPVLIDNVLRAFGVVEKYNYGWLKHMRQAFSLMSYANSCVNPIVYGFMSKNFRDSFQTAVCSCCPDCRKYKWCYHGGEHALPIHGSFTTQHSTMSFYSTNMAVKTENNPNHQLIYSKDYENMVINDSKL